jgi:serine protease Do
MLAMIVTTFIKRSRLQQRTENAMFVNAARLCHIGGMNKVALSFCTTWLALLGWAVAPVGAKQSPALADGELGLARKLESAFERVAENASESVVVITCTKKGSAQLAVADADDGSEQFDGSPFEYFFKQRRNQTPQPRDVDSQGSGIILREDGYILTNHHVVDGVEEIKVRLKDGREFDAKYVGGDPAPRTDVAVIKINAKNLTAARLSDSDRVRVGQWAIAIGAPYELDYSFTVGFVSAKGRSAVWSHAGSAYEDYIQTDASINPGNSGGPLCDIEGRVIGMNTLIRGLNRGIGFAIPINMAREIAEQLIAKGRVVRPWIGVSIESLSDNKELREFLGSEFKDGVVVKEITPGTPAAASGLKPADIIMRVAGATVKTPKELQQQILRAKVGQQISLDVIRDGKPLKINVQTAEMDDTLVMASRRTPGRVKTDSALGLTVQKLSRELARQFDLKENTGVVVTEVAEGSAAQDRGFQHGDVITEINRVPIAGVDQFKDVLAKANPKHGVLVLFKRGGASRFEVLREK